MVTRPEGADRSPPLEALADPERVLQRLAGDGIPAELREPVLGLLLGCAGALRAAGVAAGRPVCAFWVPGRIEVLGKHTDYLGGRSLLAAVDRGFGLVVGARADDRVTVTDVRRGERTEFPLSPELRPEPGRWTNYPMTVARRLARNFPAPLRGADIAIASNLPAAAGMSSSSALLTGILLALIASNRLDERETYRASIRTSEDLADYAAAVENGGDFGALRGGRGVGTSGGSEDHTAILCARAGHLVQYAFAPARLERIVALPRGYLLAVASSGVRAEKTGPAMGCYNRVAELGRRALAAWRAATGRDDPSLAAALASAADAPERLRRILAAEAAPEELLARVEQFHAESFHLVPAAAAALDAGDLTAFGAAVDRSQQLATELLGNQVEETVELARSARALGAAAASAFGAGFGGSVWALVPEREAEEFVERWRARYLQRFPARAGAEFLATRSAPPASRLL